MNNKKLLIFGILFFILSVLLSFWAGFMFFKIKYENKLEQKIFSKIWEQAKVNYLKNNACGLFDDKQLRDIKVMSGVVKNIGGRKIEVEVKPLWPFANLDLNKRIIVIKDSTKIKKRIKKDKNAYKKELKEYINSASYKSDNYIVNYPRPYIEKEISFSEIKVGDKISFKSDKNIAELKEFTVQDILVNY